LEQDVTNLKIVKCEIKSATVTFQSTTSQHRTTEFMLICLTA